MRAGTLRDRVTIQRLDTADDPAWGPSGSWSDFAAIWADVTPTQGAEAPEGKGARSENTFEVRMRFRPDVTNLNRLVYRGRTLDIVSAIDVNGLGRELLIQAKEHPPVPVEPEEVADGE